MWEYFFKNPPSGPIIALFALIVLMVPSHLYAVRRRRVAVRKASLKGKGQGASAASPAKKMVVKGRSYEASLPGQDDISLRQALSQKRAWLDFFRGAVAGHALIHYGLSFNWFEPRGMRGLAQAGIYVGLCVIAILWQMMRKIEGSVRMAVPVALIMGMCCGYLSFGPMGYARWAAICSMALVAVVAAKPLLSGPAPLLIAFIVGFGGSGYLYIKLFGATYALPVTVALCGFPLAMNLLFSRPMFIEVDEPVPGSK